MNIKPNFLLNYVDYIYDGKIQNGNIIGCHIDRLDDLNNKINHTIKIVLDIGDLGIVTLGNLIRIQASRTFKKYIKLSKYVTLYSNNVYNYNKQIISIPLGTIHNLSEYKTKKEKLIKFNFNQKTHPEYRPFLYDFLKADYIENNEIKYWKDLSSSKTHVCPIGNGIDTYRIWEGYFYNTIPIHNIYFPYHLPNIYRPCLFKLNKIKEEYNKILDNWNNFNWAQLTQEYWIKKLHD